MGVFTMRGGIVTNNTARSGVVDDVSNWRDWYAHRVGGVMSGNRPLNVYPR
jgi:hypothetical protein